MPDRKKSDAYDASKDQTLGKVVKGESPIWIRIFIGILRVWFFIYDCLNYLPYQLFNSPTEKLRKSGRVKARFVEDRDGPMRHVDGLISEDFPGKDTVDKVWRHIVEVHDESPCLGTRQLIAVHQEKQDNGRVFEKWELGEYSWLSYREVEAKVSHLSAGIKDLCADSTDPKVVIFAETRAHWMMTALACFRANIPVVTAIVAAINETDATMLVTSAELIEKLGAVGTRCKTLHTLVYFPQVDKHAAAPDLTSVRAQFAHVLSWNGLLDRNPTVISESTAKSTDIALIMYTSGTTGAAKGVILLHQNVVSAIAGQGAGVGIICKTDTYIGYLPLAHILELSAEMTCLVRGAKVGYSSPLTLHDRGSKILKGTHGDCYALRPTLLAAVPAIMDRIFKAVSEEVAASPRFMQELFKLNYERKRARYQEGYASPFLDRVIFKKIRRLLGGRLRGVLSGGAALNPETQRFMNICMCCPVVQGYGLTETCGAACVAEITDLSTGTVGPPVRCSQIALREWLEGNYSPFNEPPQGEIMITGPNISAGYWKQPEKTAEDFVEYKGKRYFATGDIGEWREDGSLLIIDRKKDLVKLQHGEYVSLAKCETALLTCPIVENICVYGSGLESFTIALVVPNQKHLEKIAEEVGVSGSTEELCANAAIWTPDSGLLTEALKLKRRPITQKYEDTIKDLYAKAGA
ncbi:acs-4 [Pristionchus pacificus]|nr:acs-4 [Pristionchus pacificus]|eukprot:PDM74717.1 acs-4 [Pristionchus pacificus]